MLTCAVVAITIATATETSIYYAYVDPSVVEHRDFQKEAAELALTSWDQVRLIRDLPGLSPKQRYHCRDSMLNLYALLTGERNEG